MQNNKLIKKEGLYAPFSYWEDKEEKSTNKIINGCGPQYLPSNLIPDRLFGLNLTPSCNIHDWMYFKAKNKNDFVLADKIFLKNMNSLNRLNKSRKTKLRKILINIYYYSVKLRTFIANLFSKDE